MNFFEILYWMGMLCLAPICVVIARDALRSTAAQTSARNDSGVVEGRAPVRA